MINARLNQRSPRMGRVRAKKRGLLDRLSTHLHRNLIGLIVSALMLSTHTEASASDKTLVSSTELTPRILVMGDSMLAWHRISGRSIGATVMAELKEPLVDRSIVAARFNYALPISGAIGLNIAKQYSHGTWDWVIMNGGGNDFWFGCGCSACEGVLNRLISPDATTGKIPNLVSRILGDGARIVYLGYLQSPGVYSVVDHCKDEDIEFEKRLAILAKETSGFYFLPVSTLVKDGDRSFHSADMIHPSIKASKIIGRMVADTIRSAKP